jgi:hypothetical protein
MSAHSPAARREATAVPLILFGEHGRTVEGYRPADEDLRSAMPALSHRAFSAVSGPHMRVARAKHSRCKTGVVGVSFGRMLAKSGQRVPCYFVQLGACSRRFRVDVLGRAEAFRRAVALRREHLLKLGNANAAILNARQQHAEQEGVVA